MKRLLLLALLLSALVAPLRAEEEETFAERTLKMLVERQKELLAEAAKGKEAADQENLRQQFERICQGYEVLLRDNPNLAAGFASYGYLLTKLGQDKQAMNILLKANQLDPNQPLVKNQIGNILAEQGYPLDALPYFLAAIKLAPKEPLYHYQLGTLLHEARDDFLKSGEWTRESIDQAAHNAFRQATELAPDRVEFAYRYATSFYDLAAPDWDGALKRWSELEEKATSPAEREMMRLHAAHVLIKQGKTDHARIVLASITEPSLLERKEKLVAQLPPLADK